MVDPTKGKSIQKIINPTLISKFYPSNIAASYHNFTQKQKEETESSFELIQSLIFSFEEFSKIIGGIIFSDHQYHSLGKYIPNNPDDAVEIKKWWELIYQCLMDFRKLEISPLISNIQEVLQVNKDTIQKMIQWIELYRRGQILLDSADGYLISFQYYYENLLMELEELEKTSIFLVSTNSNNHLFFRGIKPEASLVVAPVVKQDYIGEQIEKFRGKVIVFNENRMTIIPMLCNVIENPETKDLELSFPGFKSEKNSIQNI